MRLAQALWATLARAGVAQLYGRPLAGLPVVAMASQQASLAARAHQRVYLERAAAHLGGGRLWLPPTWPAGGPGASVVLGGPEDLGPLEEAVSGGGEVELVVAADLASPGRPPPGAGEPAGPAAPGDQVLEAVGRADRVAVLAGPGVLSGGGLAGLHQLAAAGGLGVLNTWGAKGVFDWRSHHHWATTGLQRDDFALGGLAEVELVLACGLDQLESPPERLALAPTLEVVPAALAPLAEAWPHPRGSPLPPPPLRERLGRVTQAGWGRRGTPLAPSRVTLAYSRILGPRGLVAAEPGTAGFWVARTLPTTGVGSVQVPADASVPGLAAACCLVARLRQPARAVLCACDSPVTEEVLAVVEQARSLGVELAVEAWGVEGPALGPEEHEARLAAVAVGAEGGLLAMATDPGQMEEVLDAAGPVVAWR